MGAVEILEGLLRDPQFKSGIALDHLIEGRAARYADMPAGVPAGCGRRWDAVASTGSTPTRPRCSPTPPATATWSW